MSLVEQLVALGSSLDPALKPLAADIPDVVAGLVHALEHAGLPVPDAKSAAPPAPANPELDALQAELAELAGSERAATDPAGTAEESAALHQRITELQQGTVPSHTAEPAEAEPAAAEASATSPSTSSSTDAPPPTWEEEKRALLDQIARQQVQIANSQRTQLHVDEGSGAGSSS